MKTPLSLCPIGLLISLVPFATGRCCLGRPWPRFAVRAVGRPSPGGSPVVGHPMERDRRTAQDPAQASNWVPVVRSAWDEIGNGSSLVTREDADGSRQILTVCGPDDLAPGHVSFVSKGLDRFGDPALTVHLTDEGRARFRQLADGNRDGYLVTIIAGNAWCIFKAQSDVTPALMVPGLTRSQQAKLAAVLTPGHPAWENSEAREPDQLRVDVWLILAVGVCAIAVILALMPAGGLGRSRFRKVWVVGGAVIGCVLGSYSFGFSTSFDAVVMPDGTKVLMKYQTVEVLNLVLGALVGVGVGAPMGLVCSWILRRALYSTRRLLSPIVGERKRGGEE